MNECATCPTIAPEEQMTQIDGVKGPYVCEYCWRYK